MNKYDFKLPNSKANLFKSIDGRAIISLVPLTDNNYGRNNILNTASNTQQTWHVKTEKYFNSEKPLKTRTSESNPKLKEENKLKSKKDLKLKIIEERSKAKETSINDLKNKLLIHSNNNVYSFENNQNHSGTMERLRSLLLDFENFLLAIVTSSEENSHIKIQILNTMNNMQDLLLTLKKSLENQYQNEKNLKIMKSEIEDYKTRETHLKNQVEELKSEIILLKEKNIEIKKSKKLERIKKVIEVTGNAPLCRENNDLRRRLELACMFLLSKKEKIAKLNEKNEFLNKRITDIVKSNTFTENEEQQIRELLSKKTKYLINRDNVIRDYNKKTLDFRIDNLKEKYRDLTNEILESGTEEFCRHFSLMDALEKEKIVFFITDQLKSYLEYSKRLNKILSFFLDAVNFNKEQIILHVRLNFIDVLDAERVTLWVQDNLTNEFYTIYNNQKYSIPASDPFFSKVLSEGIINNYKNPNDNESETYFYSKNLEKMFCQFNVRSVLAVPIIDSVSKQVLGIIEAINSHHLIYSFDEEYLITSLSKFIEWILVKFSIEEAENKHSRKDQIFTSIIKIMNQKNLFDLTKVFEEEATILLECFQSKLLFLHQDNLLYYNNNHIYYYVKGGIAGMSLNSNTGIYVKFPKDDECYNLNIDIECSSTNVCFYSIPLYKDGVIYCVLQFSVEKDESNDNYYKNISSHHISKLEYYKEKIIEILNLALLNASINFTHKNNDL